MRFLRRSKKKEQPEVSPKMNAMPAQVDEKVAALEERSERAKARLRRLQINADVLQRKARPE